MGSCPALNVWMTVGTKIFSSFFSFLSLVLLEYSFFFWMCSHINYLLNVLQQFAPHEGCSLTSGGAELGGLVMSPAGSSHRERELSESGTISSTYTCPLLCCTRRT